MEDSDHSKMRYLNVEPEHPYSYIATHKLVDVIFDRDNLSDNSTNTSTSESKCAFSMPMSITGTFLTNSRELQVTLKVAYTITEVEEPDLFADDIFSFMLSVDLTKALEAMGSCRMNVDPVIGRLVKQLGVLAKVEKNQSEIFNVGGPGIWIADKLFRLCQHSAFFSTSSVIDELKKHESVPFLRDALKAFTQLRNEC